MSEFTKGPWRLSRYHYPYSEIVIGDGNDSRAKAEGRLICSNESNRRPTSEYRANAHLIAAAPDMYEALDSIANGNVTLGNGKRCHTWSFLEMRERAQAALALVKDGE
jgi:hypothetical protein